MLEFHVASQVLHLQAVLTNMYFVIALFFVKHLLKTAAKYRCALKPLVQQNMRMLVFRGDHTGQCKRTGGCYNELVVAYFGTGGGVKWRKS